MGISCFDKVREFIAVYFLGCGTEIPAQRYNNEHNAMWIGTAVYGRSLSEPNRVLSFLKSTRIPLVRHVLSSLRSAVLCGTVGLPNQISGSAMSGDMRGC